MSSNPKKWILMLFAIKSSFKFPALATPSEVDRVMKDWWQMTSLQEYLKALSFYLACLMTALLSQLQFVFLWGKPLTTTETTVTWTRRILWFLTWHQSPFKNPDPFLHWLTVIGRGWSRNFKVDLRALKSQNPGSQNFFLEYLLYTF